MPTLALPTAPRRISLAAAALLLFAAYEPSARAQPPAPTAPATYQAVLELGVAGGEGSTAPLAGFTVETGRAGIGAGIHVGLDFDVRREPRLEILKAASGPVTPAYVNGWTPSVALRFAHPFSSSELSMVGRIGTTRLDSVSDAAANDIGEWTAFYDARAELRWYHRDMSEVYRSAGTLMPAVQTYGGIRHDQRFHRAGDLGGFNDPTARWFVGAMLMPFQRALISLGGGFDFETAMRPTDRLPSGVKYAIRADLDLGKALRRRPRT